MDSSLQPPLFPDRQAVRHLLVGCRRLWEDDDASPALDRAYTPPEQHARETRLRRFLADIVAEVQTRPKSYDERLAAQQQVILLFADFAREALDWEEDQLSLVLQGGFVPAITGFVRESRQFDPRIDGADLFQAARNACVMNALQALLARPVRLTASVLAYSLLYPTTDNYLDDPGIPPSAKAAFGRRLGRRLRVESAAPAGAIEERAFRLLGMIAAEFPPGDRPEPLLALRAIHEAQSRSLALLQRGGAATGPDVLGIALAKGGASVLADGYLVAGTLTEAQAAFAFGLGAYLQLADDLEDVRQDTSAGLLTVFSQPSDHRTFEALTNRTMSLGRRVLQAFSPHAAQGSLPLLQLVGRASEQLVLAAAGGLREMYEPRYLRHLERYSPFRFSAVEEQRRRLGRVRGLLPRLVDLFSGPAE